MLADMYGPFTFEALHCPHLDFSKMQRETPKSFQLPSPILSSPGQTPSRRKHWMQLMRFVSAISALEQMERMLTALKRV